ncbi:MAG: alkaline phosphatase family protein [Armatimonadaceae bacterium]
MRSSRPRVLPVLISVAALSALAFHAAKPNMVGPNPDGSFTVTTEQRVKPVGSVLEFGGRPVDAALTPDGKYLLLKDNAGFVSIDTATWKVVSKNPFASAGGGSMHGILVTRDGKRVLGSTSSNGICEATIGANGSLTDIKSMTLPGPQGKGTSYPCGIAESSDGKTLYACLSMNNSLALVDWEAKKVVKEVPVGVAPFDVVLMPDGKSAWVSNWGGRKPKEGEKTAPSGGTETLVDERGVANSGTLSLVNLETGVEIAQVAVGLHPSDLVLSRDGKTLYVANANDDTVSIVDTASRKVTQTLIVKPNPKLPFGSMPNALALTPDGKTLYVACGGNNAVAVVALSPVPKIQGWIPAGWYPGAVATDGKQVYIANIKGNGSRRKPEKPSGKGWQVYMYAGTVNRVSVPDAKKLAEYTRQAIADARVPEALRVQEKARSGQKPVPVPARVGESSVFEHIIYIIKENRTYDQIYGDMKQGDGDAELCIFGADITPNHRALAEQFVLLDNFYCNGVLSADGHSWATEGNVTDHLEKAFGGFTRSYSFGDDPLTYSSSGFLWDNVLSKGLSFINYGEMDYTGKKPDASYVEVLKDWQDKTGKIEFTHNIGIERLRRYTVPDSIGWNMDIPDVMRAAIFIRDLKKYEQENSLPNLTILYLPNDHAAGTTPGVPTPRAYMADNDLALGQVVDAVSKSKFWSKTCIFVVEDDPQAGFDHVDGHRSICLVISPYTRRGVVVSNFYNQTSVIHTMERMLGLPAMNQMDAMSPLMTACFTDKPNLKPFNHLPNKVPLTELNPKKEALDPAMRKWADASEAQNFKQFDRADEDTLNRILWHAMKGANTPYPAHLAGAHGAGLKARGLQFGGAEKEDEDE